MKYSVLLLFIAFASCKSYKPIALKNKYVETPVATETISSRDAVWEKLSDVLALNGLQIRLIDKESGLAICNEKVLTYTYEDSAGALIDPKADIVIPRQVDRHSKRTRKPRLVKAAWAIRVRPGANGKTIIAVNLLNLQTIQRRAGKRRPVYVDGARSSGNFERYIASQIE